MITAKIICDSISLQNKRITTLQLKYPRFIHAEFMTHRVFGRNASSSRAIPVTKIITQVNKTPAIPIHWGSNQPGMKADKETSALKKKIAKLIWISASKLAICTAWLLNKMGLHKQIVNRVLEPFAHIEVVVTATEWDNFFWLRNHSAAQPEIQELAKKMKILMDASNPKQLTSTEWHMPYISEYEKETEKVDVLLKCSAARCARVSYLNHDKSNPSIKKDIELFNQLAVRPYTNKKSNVTLKENEPVHLSPLDGQAKPCINDWEQGITHKMKDGTYASGNLIGYVQYRHYFKNSSPKSFNRSN